MKKKVLFLTMGPPTEKPSWLLRSSVDGEPGGVNQSLAASDSFRVKKYAEPWKLLVPDLITTFSTPPELRPSSALLLLCRENSSIASIGSTTPAMPDTPP